MASLRLGAAALTFALFWYLSHHLSTAHLGGFSLLMNAFFMFQTLPLLGMNLPLIRRVAAHPEDAGSATSNSLYFALPVALVIGMGLAVAGRWYASDGLALPFALVGFSMLPTAWTVVAECVLVGREQMDGIAYVTLLEALGRFLGASVAIRTGYGLTSVFVVFACLRVAAAVAYLFNRHMPIPRWRSVQSRILQSYRREAPTYLSIAVVTALCARVDIVLVSKLLSLRDAGVYAAAARLSDAALMVPTIAAVVIFPTQSRLFDANIAGFALLLERGVRWCLIVGFAFALLIVALSPHIVHLLFAPSLAPAAGILQILILGAAMMVTDQLLSTTMMAARAQHADLRSMTLGLIVLVALLCVLAHYFGLLGAAIAPPAALLTRCLYRLKWAQQLLSKPVLFIALRVLTAAAAAVGIWFLHIFPAKSIDLLLAFAVYALALWATRSIAATDWRALRHFLLARRRGLSV
jgi:O-antigen/teichoic acid export membrane protein